MSAFKVYGDYGYDSEQLLEEFPRSSEACDWAARYCRRDLGGYASVEVLSFHDDGEAITHFRKTTDED